MGIGDAQSFAEFGVLNFVAPGFWKADALNVGFADAVLCEVGGVDDAEKA